MYKRRQGQISSKKKSNRVVGVLLLHILDIHMYPIPRTLPPKKMYFSSCLHSLQVWKSGRIRSGHENKIGYSIMVKLAINLIFSDFVWIRQIEIHKYESWHWRAILFRLRVLRSARDVCVCVMCIQYTYRAVGWILRHNQHICVCVCIFNKMTAIEMSTIIQRHYVLSSFNLCNSVWRQSKIAYKLNSHRRHSKLIYLILVAFHFLFHSFVAKTIGTSQNLY